MLAMALLGREIRCAVVVFLLLHSWCEVGLGQFDPFLTESLHDLEGRVSSLEGTLHQLLGSSHPNDCSDICTEEEGVYTIQPNGSLPFRAFCTFDSEGGWTVLQRRVNGDTEFQRSWTSYRNGFGRLNYTSNFWLGLEKIYKITHQPRQYKLRVDLLGWGGETTFAEYSLFYLSDEDADYALHFNGYSGTAGDHMTGGRSSGVPFSTIDKEYFYTSQRRCVPDQGSWWLTYCRGTVPSYLNGRYRQGTDGAGGVEWGANNLFKETAMRIRPSYGDELGWEDL